MSLRRIQQVTSEAIRDVGATRPPLSIMRVISATGTHVHIDPFMPEGIDGALLVGERSTLICINGRQSMTRQRFSLGHECGHLYLHAGSHVGAYLLSNPADRTQEEREASRFASELLMPEYWLRREWRRTQDRDYLAAIFGVSHAALGVRLRELRLVVPAAVPSLN